MFPQVRRWLKAMEIAKMLFEDEGYHRVYLNEIDDFIRRKTMYSPKIDEELIPHLFLLGKAKRIPMTKLVNRIIQEFLEKEGVLGQAPKTEEPKPDRR